MEKLGDMEVYSWEEVQDELFGKLGTRERNEYEKGVRETIHFYKIGEAIRKARKEKNLTQTQLGELMGVQRAQISKIESGKNLNFTTISRAFRAMNIPAKLNIGEESLSLW